MRIKKFAGLYLIFLISFILTACCWNRCPPAPKINYLHETWPCQINLNPDVWLYGTNFRLVNNGIKDQAEPIKYDLCTNTSKTVAVSHFSKIDTNGNYQIIVVGNQNKNTVTLNGPTKAINQISVDTKDNTLRIHQNVEKKGKKICSPETFQKVVVQVSSRNLSSITNRGSGTIYGRYINSDGLIVSSYGSGNIILFGKMNLSQVHQMGSGTINILGADTPSFILLMNGDGNVNVSGRVRVHSIIKSGKGEVTILGADSNHLAIESQGSGRINVVGTVNLSCVKAKGNSKVYVFWVVNSPHVEVIAQDNARVGLAGFAKDLNVTLTNHAVFEGQSMHGESVYVRTRDFAHANVNYDFKLYANAVHESSIYYLGSGNNVSFFTGTNAVVLPVYNNSSCAISCLPPPIKMMRKGTRPDYQMEH